VTPLISTNFAKPSSIDSIIKAGAIKNNIIIHKKDIPKP
jgi:hypothetical protein